MNALISRYKTADIQYLDLESWEELWKLQEEGRINTYYKQVLLMIMTIKILRLTLLSPLLQTKPYWAGLKDTDVIEEDELDLPSLLSQAMEEVENRGMKEESGEDNGNSKGDKIILLTDL